MSDARIVVYCDGACEPTNPGGYATWGWVALWPDGREMSHGLGCIGHGPGMSNNRAEYEAVLQALRRAKQKGKSLDLHTDSQLVVQQVNGEWQVKAAHLVPLCEEARKLLQESGSTLRWVPREENARADALSKEAYRQARKGQAHAG